MGDWSVIAAKIAARALAETEAFEQSRRDRKRVPVTVAVVCGSRRGSRDMHPSAANMTPHPTENGIRQNSFGRPQAGLLPGRPARSISGPLVQKQQWNNVDGC